MSFWELVIFVLGLACPRTGILPFFHVQRFFWSENGSARGRCTNPLSQILIIVYLSFLFLHCPVATYMIKAMSNEHGYMKIYI